MAECEGAATKFRVVRCPKCNKLLPELADFTVYRCGGCDATLQAKKQPSNLNVSASKSDGGLVKCSEKNPNVDAESHAFEFEDEQGLNKTCVDDLEIANEKIDVFKVEGSPRMISNKNFKHRSVGSPVDGLGKGKVENDHEFKAQTLVSNGHPAFRPTNVEGEEMTSTPAFQGISKVFMGYNQAASYPVLGPTSCNYNPHHISPEGAAKRKNIEGSDRVELLEQDRAELLRKLDELRDQLKRSCEVVEIPKEHVPVNNMPALHSRGSLFPDGSSELNCNHSQHSPFTNGQNVDMPRFFPPTHLQNGVRGCREASSSCSLTAFNCHGQYPLRSSNNYIYGKFDPNLVRSCHNDGFYHQPACSCMHCYNGQWLPPAQVPSTVPSNLRVPPCSLGNHGFHAGDGPSMFGAHGYNHRVHKAPLYPYDLHNQHNDTFPRKDKRPCRPVAGASPFIVCYNCSELLQIPEEFLRMGKHQHKLRCGSCSQLISFELDGRRLVSSNNVSTLPTTSENENLSNGLKDVLQCRGNINRRQVISYSIDYDSPNYYDAQSSDEKVVLTSFPISNNTVENECGLNLSDSEKVRGLCSSSGTSEGVESPDTVIFPGDVPSSTELPAEGDAITRVPSLPLREHFGYPSGNQIADDTGSGSRSRRSDQERVASYTTNFKQNSVKDVPVATEMDLSTEDYPNAGFSQESWDANKEEEEPRVSKGGDSFLAGLIKKSFKDFSRFNQSTEGGRSKVSINGHSISDRLVKRAEKLAGPIHPGDYWYDYRAGFWGVMGHACLGIIPPFIEEFNYPMKKKCAAGNTSVFVNGRELNDKDLTLLSGRGLPGTSGRSYVIEISGKVWDEESGEELDCLGKLAPTVERVKRGFGMRTPRDNS